MIFTAYLQKWGHALYRLSLHKELSIHKSLFDRSHVYVHIKFIESRSLD